MRKINLKNVLVLRYSKLSQAMLCYAMLSYADKPKFCDSLVTGTMQRKKAMSRISMKKVLVREALYGFSAGGQAFRADNCPTNTVP